MTLALVALGVALGWVAWTFNALVGLRNRLRAAWADVDALLKRRADLIPNLVAAVGAYAEHERRTFEEVTEARALAAAAGGGPARNRDRAEAESALGRRLGRLLAVAEAYPELRASANFLELQTELVRTEDDLAGARRYYNAVVRDFNTRRERFPDLLVAGALGFERAEHFEVTTATERAAPEASIRADEPAPEEGGP